MRFIAILLALSTAALAHDAYPRDCCSGDAVHGDCRPVACAEIEQTGPAVWRHGRATFNANALRLPIDGRCHVCKSEPFGRCIFFPQPNVS